MALRDEIQKKIERKRREIADLETKLKAAAVYIQALEDTLKLFPQDDEELGFQMGAPSGSDALRSGSKNDRARQILRQAGAPLHVSRILEQMGERDDADSRAALVGSLGAYVRDRKIFTRPGPNTFGLIEFEDSTQPLNVPPGVEPPPPSLPKSVRATDFQKRLYATLVEAKNLHLADAVEHAEILETPTEITFTAAKVYQMFLKDAALDGIIKRIAGRPVRVVIKVGDVTPPSLPAPRPPTGFGIDPPDNDELDNEPPF